MFYSFTPSGYDKAVSITSYRMYMQSYPYRRRKKSWVKPVVFAVICVSLGFAGGYVFEQKTGTSAVTEQDPGMTRQIAELETAKANLEEQIKKSDEHANTWQMYAFEADDDRRTLALTRMIAIPELAANPLADASTGRELQVIRKTKSPDGSKELYVFGSESQIGRGFFVIEGGKFNPQHYFAVKGDWNHLSIKGVKWDGDSAILFQRITADESGTSAANDRFEIKE